MTCMIYMFTILCLIWMLMKKMVYSDDVGLHHNYLICSMLQPCTVVSDGIMFLSYILQTSYYMANIEVVYYRGRSPRKVAHFPLCCIFYFPWYKHQIECPKYTCNVGKTNLPKFRSIHGFYMCICYMQLTPTFIQN